MVDTIYLKLVNNKHLNLLKESLLKLLLIEWITRLFASLNQKHTENKRNF